VVLVQKREGEGGLHWGQRWWMGGLTVKWRRQWRSDGNQRGGISGGRSQRVGCIRGKEGGELELRLGRGTEQSEAPACSPNRRARGESRGGNGGVGSGVPHGGGRKGERGGRCGVGSQTMGSEWLWVVRSEVTACAREGGGLTNRGKRRGTGDAADRWGRVATGPGVSGGVRRERGKRGGVTVGH
jgi:hypothetical protein